MGLWSRKKKQAERRAEGALKNDEVSGEESSTERFCRSDLYRFSAGEDFHLVYSSFHRRAHLLPSHTLHLLDSCSTFKSIADHAESYFYSNPDFEHMSAVHGQLSELASAGLLISYSELLEHCKRNVTPPSANQPLKIQSVGVVTRNRVNSLQNCLSSYIENVKRHGRASDFIVMDDSPQSEVQQQTERMLGELRSRYNTDIYYATFHDKKRFAESLVAAGDLPPDVVDFALFDTELVGYSVGANRNALVLDTVGDLVFSVDDDTKCYLAADPQAKEELTFDSNADFMKFQFYDSRETALQLNPPTDVDVLAAHEHLLGRRLDSCLLAHPYSASKLFDRINSRHVRDIQSGRGRVLATFMGLVGDSAMPAPAVYLMLSGEARAQLVQSEASYLSAFSSREGLRVADRLSIDANAWCVTAAYGFDNRHFLPPFMPVGRGEDDIFGFTLNSCYEEAYLGYIPLAVLHDPQDHRVYRPSDIQDFATRLRMCSLVLACLTSFNRWPGLTAEKEKVGAMGKYLMDLGSLAQRDFDEFARVQLLRMYSDNISFMEALLQRYERSPRFWADDLENYLDMLRQSLTAESYTAPYDLSDGRSPDDARKLSRHLIFRFGQLLYWWPAIIETSKGLRANGTRLTTKIR